MFFLFSNSLGDWGGTVIISLVKENLISRHLTWVSEWVSACVCENACMCHSAGGGWGGGGGTHDHYRHISVANLHPEHHPFKWNAKYKFNFQHQKYNQSPAPPPPPPTTTHTYQTNITPQNSINIKVHPHMNAGHVIMKWSLQSS